MGEFQRPSIGEIPCHVVDGFVVLAELGVEAVGGENQVEKVILLIPEDNGIEKWIFNIFQSFHEEGETFGIVRNDEVLNHKE